MSFFNPLNCHVCNLYYRSDCWNDVDETEYACSEKKRILLKLKPPGMFFSILLRITIDFKIKFLRNRP